MPLFVTRRSESCEKRCGIQESTAMFERMRGPSRNPVCAATKSSAAAARKGERERKEERAGFPLLPPRLAKLLPSRRDPLDHGKGAAAQRGGPKQDQPPRHPANLFH